MNNLKHGFYAHCRASILASTLTLLMPWPLQAQETTETLAKPRPAKVITVQERDTGLKRQYPAIVYPSQEAELSFRVSGQVTLLPVRAATTLKQGDVIAELDKRDFENAVARLESQRDQAQAQMEALIKGARAEEIVALQAAIYAAQARVDQAREQTARTRELFDKEIVAQAQLEKDEATLRVAQAELRTSQEQLRIGQSGGREEDVDAAEAVLRGLEADVRNARDNLADATLRAPFDGIVARRHIDNFTNIRAGDAVVLMQKLSTVDLVFDVPGADILVWAAFEWENLDVEVELTGSDIALTASELVEFSTQADAGTQTYQARISVVIPDDVTALAGMVGRVRIKSRSTGLIQPTVPITALATTPDGSPFVWIVDPSSKAVSARPVTTGEMTGAQVTITQGLKAGETIVTAGVSRLSDGLVIRPITKVGN
jgi:multidrug efflux system membrane fusion protein